MTPTTKIRRTLGVSLAALAFGGVLAGCSSPSKASVASENLSTAAENFEIGRRVVFINTMTGENLLEVIGRCNIEDQTTQLEVTCQEDGGKEIKHFLGLTETTTYVAEQLDAEDVSTDHVRVIYRPQTILPDVELG